MNTREMKLIQRHMGPVREIFKQAAKLAVAGLLLVSPPVLSGCCKKKPVMQIAGPHIPKEIQGYTRYRIVGPEKPAEKSADAGVEEALEAPVKEANPIDENPFAEKKDLKPPLMDDPY